MVGCGAREVWIDVDRIVERAVEKEKVDNMTASFIVTVHQTMTLGQENSAGPAWTWSCVSRQSACRINATAYGTATRAATCSGRLRMSYLSSKCKR